MNNKFRFIFPRLIGATVIVGIASFILITLFKLLAALAVIAGVATLIARSSGRHYMMQNSGEYGQVGHGGFGPIGKHNRWASRVTVNADPVIRAATIVPIN
ncbi:hypothetical protein [Dyadobacter sp. NIV53]|uniref:hypothetical protein n=1 Tax=Dyadobacter sp. NIV53 TaxID=2861765 RepID=UPI001C86A50C|nr:hypothetical protein [Dyadobacter sp. NIV53]